MSLTEVSEMCGYNDYRYFSRVFKAETGKAPSEYANKVLKDTVTLIERGYTVIYF